MRGWGQVSRSAKTHRDSIFWLDKTMSEERTKRPESKRPKMDIKDRAKQFAPYAALGRLDSVLGEVERKRDVGDPEREIILEDLTMEEIELFTDESLKDGETI